MTRAGWGVVVSLALAMSPACTKKNPRYCEKDTDCASRMCNEVANECINPDGGGDAGDAGDARDGGDAEARPQCTPAGCADGGYDGGPGVCAVEAGVCVECLADTDCKETSRPICNKAMQICERCKTDSQCAAKTPDPGICMFHDDGRCATSNEVIYVEYNSNNCPNPTGSSTSPFCAPNDAVARLGSGKDVIVIRGGVSAQMVLNTTGIAPVIIGRKNAGGVDGSIPATAGTAITVASDAVLIRDLLVNLGSTGSKGIVVGGSGTSLQLIHVDVSTGMGLGIQADTGASLTMDRCTVTNNAVGGLLINGASYDVQNSIFGANAGYGVQFSAPRTPSQFRFNTVVGTIAALCELANPQMLGDSIVVGAAPNCMLPNSVTMMPTFTSSPAYHLTGPLACPMTPAAPVPDHDIDGDVRTPPLDCGADEFIQ